MENQKNKLPPPPETDAASPPPPESANPASSPPQSNRNSGDDHISLSSPAGSPPDSYSSPLHSKHNSSDHISLSPPPGNSPARSSAASDHITINHSRGSSPEFEKNRLREKKLQARSSLDSEYITFDHRRGSSPENEDPQPPMAVVVRKDVYKGPVEDRTVVEPMAVVSRAVMEEPKAADPVPEVGGGGGGSRRRRAGSSLSILRRGEREKMVRKAALGFRVFGFLFCLVSFAVMAADRNQGWALDSFDRYKEFRYCMSVNVIGFVYSGAQALDMSYNLATGKYHQQKLRHYFDFAADQMIAYLLVSASSSAAIRIDDWQLNWGKDKFPDLATASVSMSFLAFVALASTSLISGYALCTSKST